MANLSFTSQGDRNDFGSEHSVDGIKYPLELHLVHESMEYNYHPVNQNKIAVLAVFFVIGRENPFFRHLIHSVHELTIENKRLTVLPHGDNGIVDVLPDNLESFFVYNGSLTTPHCNETVRWIVFKNIMEVSEDQVNIRIIRCLEKSYRPSPSNALYLLPISI